MHKILMHVTITNNGSIFLSSGAVALLLIVAGCLMLSCDRCLGRRRGAPRGESVKFAKLEYLRTE